MKTQINTNIRLGLILALTLGALITSENSAKAQNAWVTTQNSARARQFSTGVNLTVVQQPGRAYFNPVQQQYLLAMQQRQHALSN